MPLFALSWNIIGIGFILAMNFFAVDYALHLFGFSKQKECRGLIVRADQMKGEISSIDFRIVEKAIKHSIDAQLSSSFLFPDDCFSLKEPLYYGLQTIVSVFEIHLFSLSRRGPPSNV